MSENKQGKKVGRARVRSQRYKAARTREKNKARKMARYVQRHPNDKQAEKSLCKLVNAHSFLWKAHKAYAP